MLSWMSPVHILREKSSIASNGIRTWGDTEALVKKLHHTGILHFVDILGISFLGILKNDDLCYSGHWYLETGCVGLGLIFCIHGLG